MKSDKETIKINGKTFNWYYDPINNNYLLESPRTKKAMAVNGIILHGGNVTKWKECKCCGEDMPDGKTYVKPLPKKQLNNILNHMAKLLEDTKHED